MTGKTNMVAVLLLLTASRSYAQDTVYLATPGQRPWLSVFSAAGPAEDRIGVIVCSGGSYGRTADEEEGIPAAKRLQQAGLSAFVLDYRIPQGHDSLPLADAQSAIVYLREHAAQYHLRDDGLGIMGFSAGGHLVSTIGTHFQHRYLSIGEDQTKMVSLRPDFMVLVYPVISFADSLTHLRSRKNFLGEDMSPPRILEFSNELQVTSETPPVFLVAAIDDPVVKVENSLYFAAACRQQRVPVELFLYARGGHGFGTRNDQAAVQWTEPCIEWIKKEAWKP